MNYTKGEWKEVEEPQGVNQLPRTDIMAFQDRYKKNVCQLSVRPPEEELANSYLISAAPNNYEANREYDLAIGKFIMALAGGAKLADAVLEFITPAQDNGRKAIAKAEGKG